MKKLIITILALITIAATSVTAFASTDWNPDPDPGEPTNPWTSLDMSIPVKFIWAAFDDGTNASSAAVVSPTYKIINNSQKDVEVSVTHFDKTNDLAAVDGSVTLKFDAISGGMASPTLDSINSASPGSAETLGVLSGTATTGSSSGQNWNFTIDGTHTPDTGGWPTVLKTPDYKVIFNFSLQ